MRRVVTLGSGKGGTGRSFLAANLGLALAQGGVRTCLVDLDFCSADLHLLLGQLQPQWGVLEVLRGEALSLTDVMQATEIHPALFLVPGAGETVQASSLSSREIERLMLGLNELPADIVIVDLPGNLTHQVLDLFLVGDVQLVVTTPDPVAVTDAARFLRLARVRHAAHGIGQAQAARSPKVYTSLDELVRDMNAIRLAEEAGAPPSGFNPALVLNRCRPGVDQDHRELVGRLRQEVGDGVPLPIQAEVPEDAAADRSTRLLAPLIRLAPTAPASRIIANLAALIAPMGPAEGCIAEGEEALAPIRP